MRNLLLFLVLGILVGCGQAENGYELSGSLPPVKTDNLPSLFDCVRESNGVLIASHRAGPAQGFPENALQTLGYGFSKGIRVFEIDIATSRDGVLFLMQAQTRRQ